MLTFSQVSGWVRALAGAVLLVGSSALASADDISQVSGSASDTFSFGWLYDSNTATLYAGLAGPNYDSFPGVGGSSVGAGAQTVGESLNEVNLTVPTVTVPAGEVVSSSTFTLNSATIQWGAATQSAFNCASIDIDSYGVPGCNGQSPLAGVQLSGTLADAQTINSFTSTNLSGDLGGGRISPSASRSTCTSSS